MPVETFVCFYCGNTKAAGERSDEHIVASSIGGTRNVTLTRDVCRSCNAFMDREVDRPFARDWFIDTLRLGLGLRHRGKPPMAFMGLLTWHRAERVRVYQVGQATIFVIGRSDDDEQQRLAVALDESDSQMVADVKRAIKERFPTARVINDKSARPEDAELLGALKLLGQQLNVTVSISVVAWHRAIVKMALGLGCMTFGERFVTSSQAFLLRRFLFENDAAERAKVPVRGQVGVEKSKPTLTALWHPGGDEHLFAILSVGGVTRFVVNLFGRHEQFVEIDATGTFGGDLPGVGVRGVAWIVDPVAKTTKGPMPVTELWSREGAQPEPEDADRP